jgi:putative effector of murein hydrolase LrgA (UPF0299 family)
VLTVRAILACAMIVVGIGVIVRLLPYPIAQTYTGMVLGLALIALGLFRLKQIAFVRRTR